MTDEVLLKHLLDQASQAGEFKAGIEGLREQQKEHAKQMLRDNLEINLKLDSQDKKLDGAIEYINTQKGQKIAIIGFATVFAAAAVKACNAVAAKLTFIGHN